MFDDDPEDRPSTPPAPPRPLTIPAAVLWQLFAVASMLLLLGITEMAREGAVNDLVNAVACLAAAYAITVMLIVRVHEGARPLRAVLAIRPTHPGFYVLGLGLGLLLQIPAELVQRGVDLVWPVDPAAFQAQAEALRMDTTLRKVMIPLMVIVVGPVAEELMFRGALHGGLRRVYPQRVVVPVVAALFAGAHLNPRVFVPIFVVACAVTGLRAASGSIIPTVLAHVTFNAVPIAGLVFGFVSMTPDPEPLPIEYLVTGVGGSILLIALMVWLARRSAWAHQARLEDLA